MRDICIAISSIRNSTAATKSVAFWRLWGKILQVYQMKKFDVTDFLEILQECCMNIKQQKCKRIFRYHRLLLKYRAANFAI